MLVNNAQDLYWRTDDASPAGDTRVKTTEIKLRDEFKACVEHYLT